MIDFKGWRYLDKAESGKDRWLCLDCGVEVECWWAPYVKHRCERQPLAAEGRDDE